MKVRPKNDVTETKGTNIPIKALRSDKDYEVILIEKGLLKTRYYIVDDMMKSFPIAWSSKLFTISEGMSEDWVKGRKLRGFTGKIYCPVDLYEVMSEDRSFYEGLVDGEPSAIDTFNTIFPGVISKNGRSQ